MIDRKSETYASAFKRYLRVGLDELRREDRAILGTETRDMGEAGLGSAVATGAGILVPVGFENRITEALKYYGGMLDGGPSAPTIMPTLTGQSLPWPTDSDATIQGERVTEGQQVSMQDVPMGQVIFGSTKYSSKMIKISIELLQDAAFDLDAWLSRKIAMRIGRIVNSDLTTGTGSSMPKGLITAALGGTTITAIGSVANDGIGGFNTIGSDDLVNLEHSVDPLYRHNAAFMMHDGTFAAIKRLKTKFGQPLWQPEMIDAGEQFHGGSGGAPGRLLGYPLLINNNMDQLQTVASSPTVTRNTIVFGDLALYTVRRVGGITLLRLTERFADFGQVAFLAFARYDGNLLDAGTHPVSVLQNIG